MDNPKGVYYNNEWTFRPLTGLEIKIFHHTFKEETNYGKKDENHGW